MPGTVMEKFRHILSIKMVNTIVTNMVVRKLMRKQAIS